MTPEQYRRAFEKILKRDGAYETERRIHRRKLWREYDSRYPYDSTTKAKDIEFAYDLSDDQPAPLDKIIAQESRDAYMALLTPMQRDVAIELEKGLKPRDIAALQGKDDSGSIRWLKNAAKKRLQEEMVWQYIIDLLEADVAS